MELFPYQQDCINTLRQAVVNKENRLLVKAPCSFGKTIVFCKISVNAREKGHKVLIIMDSVFLVEQTVLKLKNFTQDVGVYCATLNKKEMNTITVSTIQSIKDNVFDIILVDECFDDETEILTEDGFVFFKDLKEEKVAQVDSSSGLMSFVRPIAKIKRAYNGNMLHFKSDNNFDIKCTPNHEMLIHSDYNGWHKVLAKDFSRNAAYRMMKTGMAYSEKVSLTPLEKFLIAFQADGSIHFKGENHTLVYFSFSKERKIKDIIKIFKKGKFDYREIKIPTAKGNIKPKRRFSVRINIKFKDKKIGGFFKLEDISKEKAMAIVSELIKWDGHIPKKSIKNALYSNSCKDTIDLYQSICCLAGYKTKITTVVDERKESYKKIYRLFIVMDNLVTLQYKEKEISKYKGFVYCVSVPTSNILIRRNGKTAVVGNCHGGQERWQKFLNDTQIVIGFTATPFDAKGRAMYGKDKFFPSLTYSMSVSKLLELNRITPMKYGTEKEETKVNLKHVKMLGGDFKESDLQKVYEIEKDKVVLQLEDMLARVGSRNKVIIMTTGIDHANFVESKLENSLAYHSKIDNKRRAEILHEFEHGSVKFLIGVMAIYKGLDITSVDCIVNMRPTRSKSFWVQLCGRGVRKHPGKENCVILDYGQTVENLGFYEDITEENRAVVKGLAPEFHPKKCPDCLAMVRAQVNICDCGYVFKKVATKGLDLEAFKTVRAETYKHKIESVTVNHNYVSKKGHPMKTIKVGLEGHVDLIFFYPEFKKYEFFSIVKELAVGKNLVWGYKDNFPVIRAVHENGN